MWGAIAGAVGTAALDYFTNQSSAKQSADWQNAATIQQMKEAPSAQMEGFRRAGLNPMLAYQRMDFPTASAPVGVAQMNTSGAIPASIQAAAASKQADTAAEVGSASSALMKAQAKTEFFRAAVSQNDAIKGNYAVMQLAGTLDAAMQITKTSNGPDAMAALAKPQIQAGLAELRAALASANNDAAVYEALNSKAVQIALDVLGRLSGSGSAIAGAVDRYRARSQRGQIIDLNKD